MKPFFWIVLLSFFSPPFFIFFADASVLQVSFPDPPATLDWNEMVTTIEAPIVVNLAEGLFTYEPISHQLVPAVAEGVKKNKDLTEFTFTLSPKAKWSDGRAVTAQHFVDSWAKLISPQNTSLYSYYLFDIVNAEAYHQNKITHIDEVGMKAIDAHTLRVTLIHPQKNWEANTVFWPLFPIRKDLEEKFGSNWSKPGVMVSNGAYQLDSYEVGKEMVLKKNPYYSKPILNEEVHIHFSLDQKKTIELYQQGFFPFIHASEETEKLKLHKRTAVSSLQHFTMTVNAKKYPMNDRSFREAIFKSIDLREVFKKVSGYPLSLADNLIPDSLRPKSNRIMPEFSPEKAKVLLKKSGFVGGNKSKITLLTRLVEPFPAIGSSIKDQITKNLGMNVELSALRTTEFNTYAALNDYDLAIINWVAKIPEAQDFLRPYSPNTPNSRLIFDNSFYPEWLTEGILTESKKEAFADFDQAQKLYIQDESVLFPLFFGHEVYYLGSSVQAAEFDYMAFPLFRTIKLSDAKLLPEKNPRK